MKVISSTLPAFAMAAIQSQNTSILSQHSNFVDYMTKHGKSYTDQTEFNKRLQLYIERDDYITAHNASGKDWTLAHNKFSDMTTAEYS